MLAPIQLGNDPALEAELGSETLLPLGSGDAVLAGTANSETASLNEAAWLSLVADEAHEMAGQFSSDSVTSLRKSPTLDGEKGVRALIAGAAASVLLHAILLASLLSVRVLAPDSFHIPLDAIEVALIKAEPDLAGEAELTQESVQPISNEPAPAAVEAEPDDQLSLEGQTQEALRQIEAPVEVVVEAPIEVPAIERVEQDEPNDAAEPTTTDPDVLLPSLYSLRRTLDQLDTEQRRQRSASVRRACTVLERDDQLIECVPRDARNYQTVEANEVYRGLNPIREVSRSQRTLRTVAGQSAALAERLESSDIPQGLSDYVLTEIEAGLEIYTNSGNRQLQDQQRATTTWDPVQQAVNRVMNNPINRAAYKEKAERQVHLPD